MRLLATAALMAGLATSALAQTPPPVTVEGLDRGLTNLGLMAGHAIQCLPEAEKPQAQRALLAFNSILIAEMGANAAFRFATAYGAGSRFGIIHDAIGVPAADPARLAPHRIYGARGEKVAPLNLRSGRAPAGRAAAHPSPSPSSG